MFVVEILWVWVDMCIPFKSENVVLSFFIHVFFSLLHDVYALRNWIWKDTFDKVWIWILGYTQTHRFISVSLCHFQYIIYLSLLALKKMTYICCLYSYLYLEVLLFVLITTLIQFRFWFSIPTYTFDHLIGNAFLFCALSTKLNELFRLDGYLWVFHNIHIHTCCVCVLIGIDK